MGGNEVSVRSAHLAHHFGTLEQQREAETLGMWIFLSTEILIFGALFTGYSAYRLWYTHAFEAASEHLNVWIGGINTLVLLSSSLTMALAVHAVHVNKQKILVLCLILTALLGTTFMVLKAVEYYSDYKENLVPGLAFDAADWSNMSPPVDARQVMLFLMFYYVMTGLHAVHLTIGIGLMIWLIVLARRGIFSSEHYSPVEVCGLYWHFVDVIWIFLLPLLYLIGTHSWHT
jgi:cytochrome c oxidase subunit 3